MCDFIHDGEAVNRPNNAMEIYLTELDNESPRLVRLIMKSVYRDDKRRIRHIGSKRFGVQFLLKGLYTHGDLLYFHTEVKNGTHVPFDVDFVSFKIVDKKIMKRTAMQEQAVYPLRAYHYITRVDGKKKGTQRLRAPEVHPAGRQETGGGTGGEAGWQTPGVRGGERGPGTCGNH